MRRLCPPAAWAVTWMLAWALTLPPAAAEPVAFTAATVGAPGATAPHHLYQPATAGPHPGVVLLHGCAGMTASGERWAARLAEWGYIALVADSFTPRGLSNICGRPGTLPPLARAEDAFAAAAWLRANTQLREGQVAAIGFSHGGGTALAVATRRSVERLPAAPFAAVVAFYPWCPHTGAPLASPLLILVGNADDWTPAARCQRLLSDWRPEFGAATLQVYPGATHAFDAPGRERRYLGHLMRYDAEAARDATDRVRRFLDATMR